MPDAALVKAIMIHGAEDLGRPGPDYEYGWGLIHARRSADLIRGGHWQGGTLLWTGHAIEKSIQVPANRSALKVTAVWTDPPGVPLIPRALVNDLDLRVIAPGGRIHMPWVLNAQNPEAPARRGANRVDNVEQVVVDNPPGGTWRTRICAALLPLPGQRFAWVCEQF